MRLCTSVWVSTRSKEESTLGWVRTICFYR